MEFLDDAAEIGVLAMNFISDGESTMVPWYAEAVEKATEHLNAAAEARNDILAALRYNGGVLR